MSRSILLALFVSLAIVPPTQAAVPAPGLSYTVKKKSTVKLKATHSLKPTKDMVLRVRRSKDGGPPIEIKVVKRPKKKVTVSDKLTGYGAFVYEARLEVGSDVSPWASLTVELAPPDACPSGYEAEVLRLVNQQRRANGINNDLRDNAQLAIAATEHNFFMISRDNLTHDGWINRIRAAGYGGGTLGQNIAYGYGTPSAVVSGWMGSSGHRANILRTFFSDSGVSCREDARGRRWWTHNFGG